MYIYSGEVCNNQFGGIPDVVQGYRFKDGRFVSDMGVFNDPTNPDPITPLSPPLYLGTKGVGGSNCLAKYEGYLPPGGSPYKRSEPLDSYRDAPPCKGISLKKNLQLMLPFQNHVSCQNLAVAPPVGRSPSSYIFKC